LLAAFLGFLILIAALIGLLLVIRHHMRPNSGKDMVEWGSIRKQGKQRYIRATMIKGILFALLAILWPLIAYYSKPKSYGSNLQSLWIFATLALAYIFGCYYTAVKTWNANETDYEAIFHSSQVKSTTC